MFLCKTGNDELQVVGYYLGFVLDAVNGERKDNLSSQIVFGHRYRQFQHWKVIGHR